MIIYLDPSAIAKLLVEEAESKALVQYLDTHQAASETVIGTSSLVETELRRLVGRIGMTQSSVTDVLNRLTIIHIERGIFREAGLMLPGNPLRSLDALHIAVAQSIAADEFVSYDSRQTEAARTLGLSTVTPE